MLAAASDMTRNRIIPAFAGAAAVAAVLLTVNSASSQTMGDRLRLTAFAMNLDGTSSRTRTATVEMTVNRWTSENARRELIDTLLNKGPDALLQALQKQPSVGRIRTPDSLGYDLRFAHERPGEDGGRTIVLITDRPIGYWEAVNRPRTIDYPFTVIEIHLNADGDGEGKLSIATKITVVGKDTISLENYTTQPVLLKTVKAQKI